MRLSGPDGIEEDDDRGGEWVMDSNCSPDVKSETMEEKVEKEDATAGWKSPKEHPRRTSQQTKGGRFRVDRIGRRGGRR